jgi:glycosyltransferase involved in cell wall biosynthesis
MRILWITHDVLPEFAPYVSGDYSLGGSWIAPLFYSVSKNQNVELGILSPVVNGACQNKNIQGIQYYTIPINSGANGTRLNRKLVEHYLRAINQFKPDIIHIHGIEKNFGLITKYIDPSIPVVCSIQGIITSYHEYLELSELSFNKLKFKSIKSLLGLGGGIKAKHREWKKYSQIEQEIINTNKYFIGRTSWDQSQLITMNPHAHYFHGEELLREEFHSTSWDYDDCEKNSIFISSGAYSIKGLHILLKALSLLTSKYPHLKLYIPLFENSNSTLRKYILGNEYNNYVQYLIRNFNLDSNIVFLPRLSAKEMANRFSKSHIFVLPSFIENSPNSLGEAMQTGVPSVVSYCGGIGSIVKNRSSLLFPIGDYRMLAFQINRIFESEELARDLSKKSKLIAIKRHNVEEVTASYLHTYNRIISLHKTHCAL